MAMSTQSSNKGKGKTVGTGRRKGKKIAGTRRGKAKIIATGHKSAKRGKGSEDEGNEGVKKSKTVNAGSSEMVIFRDLKGLDISIVEDWQKGPMFEASKGIIHKETNDEEAEAGESQPHLEP